MSVIPNKLKKKEKKKVAVLLKIYKFEAYNLSLPEKLLKKFLMQRKNQLVSEKVMKSKVCKPREGRLTCYLDRLVQSALTNYCKKDLFGCTKSMIIILYFTITPDKNKKVLFKSILLKLLKF